MYNDVIVKCFLQDRTYALCIFQYAQNTWNVYLCPLFSVFVGSLWIFIMGQQNVTMLCQFLRGALIHGCPWGPGLGNYLGWERTAGGRPTFRTTCLCNFHYLHILSYFENTSVPFVLFLSLNYFS